jgi:CRP/FNR family cyclic AMP-dependent transcriptional regulator
MTPHSTPLTPPRKGSEDPLAYLPCSQILEYRRGEVIYNRDEPSTSIYLVIDGAVKISFAAEDGHRALIDIYHVDEFFGEFALVSSLHRSDEAMAIENTKLMFWTAAEIEDIVIKRPQIGVALLQILVQRTFVLSQRIESFTLDNIPRRLAGCLFHFAERLGVAAAEDGSITMKALTHEFLSQYIGTTREMTTRHMIELRRLGYLRYTRKEIILYPAFREWLRRNAVVGDAPVRSPASSDSQSS